MLNGSFTGTGSSAEWYALRSGFAVGITISAGSNSLTLERELDGSWYTIGSAKTATGLTNLIGGVDYVPGSRFRLTCGTFNTGPVTYAISGDIVGAAVIEDMGLILEDTLLLEDGDPLLRENSEYLALEAA